MPRPESLCPAQMVTWCLDMTALRPRALACEEGGRRRRASCELWRMFMGSLGGAPRQQAVRRGAARCRLPPRARAYAGQHRHRALFLATRGLRACACSGCCGRVGCQAADRSIAHVRSTSGNFFSVMGVTPAKAWKPCRISLGVKAAIVCRAQKIFPKVNEPARTGASTLSPTRCNNQCGLEY